MEVNKVFIIFSQISAVIYYKQGKKMKVKQYLK